MATLSGRTRGTLGPPHRGVLSRRGEFGSQSEHWRLGRDRLGRFRSTARENPASDAWWIFGVVAGAGAIIAGIAYAATRASAAPSPTTPAPTTAAPVTTPPVTTLVQGHSYSLVITCPTPIPRPDATVLSALGAGAVSNVTVLPPMLMLSGNWTINFTYTGASGVAIPALPLPACTSALYDTTASATMPPSPTQAPVVVLSPGQKYRLLVACISPITAPDPTTTLSVLGSNVSNVAVAPPGQPPTTTRTAWAIDFTYTGSASIPVPVFTVASGCSAAVTLPTNPNVNV